MEDQPLEEAADAAVAPEDEIVLDRAALEDRILTLPNLITVVRLCTLPVFVYLLFGADDRWAAGWVLFAIGSTDWLDGYLARRLGQVSTVGKVLDPVADRLLFFVGVGSIIIDGSVPLWFAVAVLVREVAVAVGTLSLAAMGATRIDVTWFGKAATFLLMGAFPAFLVGASDHGTADGFRALAWAVGVPGLVLAYWSALLYVPLGRKALAEGRAARAGGA
ncbi:MAG TPA: CDP-alcohol phosphatidyltransferase family protein [Acidimicrobiales bacterium]|nr:CDP-alcohol phosphatidyltransferase family protein [Acidimicrobiales bacterium]